MAFRLAPPNLSLDRFENRTIILIKKGQDEILASDNENGISSPLFISFQNHQQICYSRLSEYKPRVHQVVDMLTFNATKLSKLLEMKIFIHYPNQLLRNFDKKFIATPIGYFTNQGPNAPNEFKYKLFISQISVIRKRFDSSMPCDPMLLNDDQRLRKVIMENVGCIPSYWSSLSNKDAASSLPSCNTSSQLNDLFEYQCNCFETCRFRKQSSINGNAFEMYDPPCTDMSVNVMIQATEGTKKSAEGATIELNFIYMPDTYQETINTRDMTFESFFSGVGGFVGIFVGYSLLSLIDVFIAFLNWMFGLFCEKK